MQSSEQTVRGAVPATQAPAAEPVEAAPEAEPTEHIHLPPLTIWPLTTAGGVTLGFMGFVTSYWISFMGVLIAVYGIVSWVQELRHERH